MASPMVGSEKRAGQSVTETYVATRVEDRPQRSTRISSRSLRLGRGRGVAEPVIGPNVRAKTRS